jgi:hypothetical protein
MATEKLHGYLSRVEGSELVDSALKVAGFDLGKRPTFGTAANVSGVRTRNHTFSRRRDSLTIFANDTRYGIARKAGAWTGDDRTIVAACRRVLRAARVPRTEIDSIDVVSEFGAVAERLSEDEIRVEEPEILRKVGRVRRAVEGLPVWSSHLMVGLTRSAAVGHLELHWPRLAPEAVQEAKLLEAILKRGWEPPEVPDARPESMDAGVLHSSAIGFHIDVVACIRVIFAGANPTLGRKPSLYLDRHGELVSLPRSVSPVKGAEIGRSVPA